MSAAEPCLDFLVTFCVKTKSKRKNYLLILTSVSLTVVTSFLLKKAAQNGKVKNKIDAERHGLF